jgi:cellulose synthase/poly-beta-1,6-N-acetylglucosamine synthase-like glycosyltransferase
MNLPRVNVIIPAFNEEKVILDCLSALQSQSYQNFKASIIDDCSTDNTRDLIHAETLKSGSKLELLEFGKVGPGKARNLVADLSDAEILVFTDADCVPRHDWLERLIESFQDSRVASAGGPQLMHKSSNNFQKKLERVFQLLSSCIDFYKPRTNTSLPTNHNPLCNVAYRTEVFKQLKGFREDLFPGEDVEIDLRVKSLGYEILYNPHAIVEHHRPENILQWNKVARAYGRAQGKLVREYGFRRKIQIIATLILLVVHTVIIAGLASGSTPVILTAGLVFLAFWFFRPPFNSYLGIICGGLSWFNGFLIGLATGKAPPPQGVKKTESQQT